MTSEEKKRDFVEWCKAEQEKLYERMYEKAREELEEEEEHSEEVTTPTRKRARNEEPTKEQIQVGYFVYHMIKWGLFKESNNKSVKIGEAPEELKQMFKDFKLTNPNQAGYRLYKKYEEHKDEWDTRAEALHLDNWIEELHKKRPPFRPKEFYNQDEEVTELKHDREHFTDLLTKKDTFKNYTMEEDGVLKSKQFPKYKIVMYEPDES